jgi:UDP-N-acetylglucosamine transferase subunit ALG13
VNVFVTVGMSEWPFDRLIRAGESLCAEHDVFVQRGSSSVAPPCPSIDFLPYPEMLRRIAEADVVVTHAGNTVRLVQRAGKVPIAVARTARKREMPNDHQVAYLEAEEQTGRVVAVWNAADLPEAVRAHPAVERTMLSSRALEPPVDPERVAVLLDELWLALAR